VNVAQTIRCVLAARSTARQGRERPGIPKPSGLFFRFPGRFRGYNPRVTVLETCPAAWGLPHGEKQMALNIERRTSGEIVILDLKGRATIGTEADRLHDALRAELSAGTRKLLVNLSALVQVDSSGLATIVRSFVSMGCSGGAMRLVVPPGRVREVFEVTQLSKAIQCLNDEASALATFH